MSLTDKTIASTFKDVLVIENSNAGFDTNIDQVKSGNGNGSSIYLSTNNLKVQPTSDSTTVFRINDKDGNFLLGVDSSNDTVVALGNNINTQYAYFGANYRDIGNYVADTHYPIPFSSSSGGVGSTNDVDFGTGTDPDDSYTTADTDTQYAAQIVPMMWLVPDNISIDSVTHIEGASIATGEVNRCHLKSFDFTSGSTSCLANGTLLAHNSDVTNAGNEQAYLSTWTVDSASVASGKVILCFFRSDSTVNSDYSLNVTIKYHLT